MIHDSNPHQHESLLPPAQVRNAGHAVDECPSDKLTPRGEYGTQCCVVDGETLPLTFDGLKCYYQLEAISDEELLTLPKVVFTNPEEYEPAKRTTTRRMNTDEVDWKRTLAFPPDDVIKATLEATTQLIPVVEAESREIMRDHLKTRLKCLRYRRRRDMDYLDTFKANIKSVRGYNYFNLFCGKWSGYDHPILMQRKSESPRTLEDHFQHSGCPHSLKSDNAKEFKSVKFLNALRQAQVDPLYTEPHHPNQNLAELRGGRIKHIVQHILLLTGAPREYWCYCLEFAAFVRARTARRSLGNRTAFEREFGWIPDISKCRFSFWQPIWFYTPRGAFPSQRMMKGRFLGFSLDSGDAFTYIIVTEPDDENEARQVFTRSVIRPRYIREDAPVVVRSGNKFEIFKKDERTVLLALSDPEVPPSLSGFVQPQLPTIQEEPQPLDSVEEYERRIEEVYGPPPSKRLRIDPESPARFRLDPVDDQPLLDDVDSDFVAQSVETVPPIAQQELAPILELESPQVTDADPTADPADVPPRDSIPTVTQEEHDADDSDNDSVHSADADLDKDHVTADSVDTHLHNLAGDVDDEVELFDSIVGHEFRDGKLFLQVLWKTNEMSWVSGRVVAHLGLTAEEEVRIDSDDHYVVVCQSTVIPIFTITHHLIRVL